MKEPSENDETGKNWLSISRAALSFTEVVLKQGQKPQMMPPRKGTLLFGKVVPKTKRIGGKKKKEVFNAGCSNVSLFSL